MTTLLLHGRQITPARETIRYRGRGVATAPLGLGDGIWPGDLLAYRKMWDPFIGAHLRLWRDMNALLESIPTAKQCPQGIFEASQIGSLSSTVQSFCAALGLSRMYVSDTHPLGILTQWNAWSGRSSAEIVQGAGDMLKWHQAVVMRVGGPYKDTLMKISKDWNVEVTLPDLPTFSWQQDTIARIEGAYITAKGAVQIVGYGVGRTLELAYNTTEAVAKGLSDTAGAVPKIANRVAIAMSIAAVLVGGGLIMYYMPRKDRARAASR